MAERSDQVFVVFLMICVSFGLVFGCFGFGLGLLFLPLQKAIGAFILSIGFGTLYAMTREAKRIIRALLETLKEMEQEKKPE